ncbi:MAG: dockerin type I repeat-containing protein [bacterium]
MSYRTCLRFVSILVAILLLASPAFARDLRGFTPADSGDFPDRAIHWDQPGQPTWHGFQQTEQLRASFSCSGIIGNSGPYGPSPEVSFETPAFSETDYMFGGAIWIGGIIGDDTLVSVGTDGWHNSYEMFPHSPNAGSVVEDESDSLHAFVATFTDTFTEGVDDDYFGRPHIPLNLDMSLASLVLDLPGLDKIVLYDLVIRNVGAQLIEKMYTGLYFDCDIGWSGADFEDAVDDITGSLGSRGAAYSLDNDGDYWHTWPDGSAHPVPRVLAADILQASFPITDSSFNWWLSNGSPARDFGPRMKGTLEDPFRDFGIGGCLGTPEGDVNRYYIMRHNEWDYDQIFTATIPEDDPVWMWPDTNLSDDFTDGYDTRFLLSVGALDLASGDWERITFATFTSEYFQVDPNNLDNLPDNPDLYLSHLLIDSLLVSADMADILLDSLRNPLLPIVGQRVSSEDDTMALICWHPTLSDAVDSYQLFVTEIPEAAMPHPGVPPPWHRPETPAYHDQVSADHYCYELTGLDPNMLFAVNVASQSSKGLGDYGRPLFVKLSNRAPAPVPEKDFLYTTQGQYTFIKWTPPSGVDVDHYNIYRFDDSPDSHMLYHPFYDEGQAMPTFPAVDTIEIPQTGRTYYYYEMAPYAQTGGLSTEFAESALIDGSVYVITAVDIYGFESEFSTEITAYNAVIPTKDVMLFTSDQSNFPNAIFDSITTFYDSVFQGLDYAIYNRWDSIPECAEPAWTACPGWRDLADARLLVMDMELRDDLLSPDHYGLAITAELQHYLQNGGVVMYFGAFTRFIGCHYIQGSPGTYSIYGDFVGQYFGVDSEFFAPPGYCYPGWPCPDTLLGFASASSLLAPYPTLNHDADRNVFSSYFSSVWPGPTPPSVASFVPGPGAQVTHIANTIMPDQSMIEGQPVGVHKKTDESEAYAFGFHLYLMEHEDARALIDAILGDEPMTTIEPSIILSVMANQVDPDPLVVSVGNFPDSVSLGSIDLSSIVINGTIAPLNSYLAVNPPGYSGEALVIEVPPKEFIESYPTWWDATQIEYTVHAAWGDSVLDMTGKFTALGHVSGDLNGDGIVNMIDITSLTGYMFGGGPLPKYFEAANVDGSAGINIGDLVHLVLYVFQNGPPPGHP